MSIKRVFSKRLKRKVWAYDVRIHGRRITDSGFATEEDAMQAVVQLRLAAKSKQYGISKPGRGPLFSDLIMRRLPTIVSKRERQRTERVLTSFAALLVAKISITEIETPHLERFVEQRQEDGLVASSINRELNIIGATLKLAKRFFPHLAQWLPPQIPRPKQSQRRRERVITEAETRTLLDYLLAPPKLGEKKLLAIARRRVGLVLRFALLTGMRHGEIDKLRWDHINWEMSEIKAVGTKTDKDRYIPITPSMLAILQERRRESKSSFVFTRGGNTGSKFYRILRAACEACDIPYGRNIVGGLILHDARHTATTRMLHAGEDLATIGSITGHSDKTLILWYGHASRASRERAVQTLENAMSAASKPESKKAGRS